MTIIQRRDLCSGILFALTVSIYAPATRLGFIEYDDNLYVYRNDYVQAGLTSESIQYAWTTFDSGNWKPVTWMSFLLRATCFGIYPQAFHTVNVMLHSLNVMLLFLWLSRITGSSGRTTTPRRE